MVELEKLRKQLKTRLLLKPHIRIWITADMPKRIIIEPKRKQLRISKTIKKNGK